MKNIKNQYVSNEFRAVRTYEFFFTGTSRVDCEAVHTGHCQCEIVKGITEEECNFPSWEEQRWYDSCEES